MRKGIALAGMCVSIGLTGIRPGGADEDQPRKIYTNEDLERIRPFRDETGVNSTPANAHETERAGTPRQEFGRGASDENGRASAEERWRASAERLRARLQPLKEQADDLRRQIDERRRAPGVRPLTDPRVRADQRKLDTLESRIREAESAFEDRARRAGALPGWLR